MNMTSKTNIMAVNTYKQKFDDSFLDKQIKKLFFSTHRADRRNNVRKRCKFKKI